MRKVLVIGSGGAGKTTLAKRIAQANGLPLVHLDQLYWHPGWVATPNAEWDQVVAELVARNAWVMDGNYGRTLPVRLAACDTVVLVDLPRLVCLWRLIKRRWRFSREARPDVAPGCPERLTLDFMVWVWGYRSRRRPKVLQEIATFAPTARVIRLESSRDVDGFVAGFRG